MTNLILNFVDFLIRLVIFIAKITFWVSVYVIITIIEGIYALVQKIKSRKRRFKIYNKDISYFNRLVIPNRSFFPSAWTTEQVMDVINEAHDDFIANGGKGELLPGGKYKCIGKAKDGIKIEFYLTLSGIIINAFPLLEIKDVVNTIDSQ